MMFAGTAGASGQSFNIDLDSFFGDPQSGNGAPSANFGGAANQPGYWNRIHAGENAPVTLRDLQGSPSQVSYHLYEGSGIGGGSGTTINSGNYALLLHDYARVPDLMRFRFSGLDSGRYQVFTYAVDATGATRIADVTITDSRSTVTLLSGQGPMPGNQFALGITHSEHSVLLTSSTLEIEVRNHIPGPPNASVNGFQIVAVPEPASLSILGLGAIIWLRRRRQEI